MLRKQMSDYSTSCKKRHLIKRSVMLQNAGEQKRCYMLLQMQLGRQFPTLNEKKELNIFSKEYISSLATIKSMTESINMQLLHYIQIQITETTFSPDTVSVKNVQATVTEESMQKFLLKNIVWMTIKCWRLRDIK